MSQARLAVAVLGTGIMGEAMAMRLVAAGFETAVWNRTPGRTRQLQAGGATAYPTPREAASAARLVVTMLRDVQAVEEAVAGPDGALAAMGADAVWIQMSTVGAAGAGRLSALAAESGVDIVDAPVLGTREPAEGGALTILASGPERLKGACAPVFDALGSRTLWLGDAGAGSSLKVAVNSWVLAITAAVAEAISLSEGLGVDPRMFLEAISGTGVDCPYAHLKGGAMITEDFATSFALETAAKDAALVVEAAHRTGVDAAVAEAVQRHFEKALRMGYARLDMAAVYDALAPRPAGEDPSDADAHRSV